MSRSQGTQIRSPSIPFSLCGFAPCLGTTGLPKYYCTLHALGEDISIAGSRCDGTNFVVNKLCCGGQCCHPKPRRGKVRTRMAGTGSAVQFDKSPRRQRVLPGVTDHQSNVDGPLGQRDQFNLELGCPARWSTSTDYTERAVEPRPRNARRRFCETQLPPPTSRNPVQNEAV